MRFFFDEVFCVQELINLSRFHNLYFPLPNPSSVWSLGFRFKKLRVPSLQSPSTFRHNNLQIERIFIGKIGVRDFRNKRKVSLMKISRKLSKLFFVKERKQMFDSAVSKIWMYLKVSNIFRIEFEFWTHVSRFCPAGGQKFLVQRG